MNSILYSMLMDPPKSYIVDFKCDSPVHCISLSSVCCGDDALKRGHSSRSDSGAWI